MNPRRPRHAAHRRGRQGSRPPRRWVLVAGWSFVCLVGAISLAVALLPVPRPQQPPPTVIYDRRDQPVARLALRDRVPVPLSDVPKHLQQAIVATEDARFYEEHGINPASILRAAWADVRSGRIVEGGSTITQQLAKNLFLNGSRTLGRKLLEVLYTLKMEAVYSKPQILDMYLNTVYLGNGAYGVEAAARAYFGKPVRTLDLAQSALIAGLPQGPSAYDPFAHPRAALARRREVLARMAAVGYISPAMARAAAAEPLGLAGRAGRQPQAGYFVSWVEQSLRSRFPDLAQGGYRVYTTLSMRLQKDAGAAFSRYMPRGRPGPDGAVEPEGAMVVLDPHTGAVRAMIGGRNYALDPWNRAVDAHRQPGSTFKPFLYAAVFKQGYTTVSRRFDGPVAYPGADGGAYRPTDAGSSPYLLQEVTVRKAVAISDNVVAVKWAHRIGPQRVIQMARACGITSPLAPTLPLVLGAYEVTPLEIVDAYTPFDNGGLAVPAWGVRRVEDAAGSILYQPSPPRPHRAMAPGVAYLVTSVLQSVMREGTGRRLAPIVGDRPVAGKTGTTNDLKDAWFIGYTPDLLAGVWVGDDRPSNLHGYGDSLAGPVWAHFMKHALANVPPHDWPQPNDVVAIPVSAVDGLLPNPTSPVVDEVFLRGTQPRTVSPVYSTAPQPGEGSVEPPAIPPGAHPARPAPEPRPQPFPIPAPLPAPLPWPTPAVPLPGSPRP